MTTFIAAGSNLKNRPDNLRTAVQLLQQKRYVIDEVSPVYETPAALLYETAQDEWNTPYLNCIFKMHTSCDAFHLLADLKEIERQMGRDFSKRWAPRPIDLDIIKHNEDKIDTTELHIPHKLYLERSFVLDPLSFFASVPPKALYTPSHQPMIMGILNITPDSFSDGGKNNQTENFKQKFLLWEKSLVPLIDIGAESTRPNAVPLNAEDEIKRLEKVFSFTASLKKDFFSPRLSIDTYHWKTARTALQNGFEIINDVHGLDDPNMLAVAKDNKNNPCIFMHHDDLSRVSLKETITTIRHWLEDRLNLFEQNGLKRQNLIFDPGIGFGKSACQSLQILQNLNAFHHFGVRLLIGHSRKSFMKIFTPKQPPQKDTETLAVSLKIAPKTDILRVHTPIEHKEALLAAAHAENQFF
ncbi:MAG: dihydropteroate synthase [Alphaproteobacteria bacterium]|nr:dihydropteroate synthase [Alphaproteobacteria bacterium]